LEPIFLTLSEVLEIHHDQIVRYGGLGRVRDLEFLKSALGMPSATFGGNFLHMNIFEMASAYLFHIVNNHPFIDGNKRTGTVSALVFLQLNGYDFNSSEDELVDIVIKVASKKLSKSELTIFIQKWTNKIRD
jgi:death-on-curing protein